MVDGGDGEFLPGAFPWSGIGVACAGDSGSLFGAFRWAGLGVVGGGSLFGVFSWAGIGVLGDDDFLFRAFSLAVGRSPNFWKYKLQVVDSFVR